MKIFKSFLFTIIAIFLFANLANGQTTETPASEETVVISSVKVKGITCSKDVKTISDNITALKGVSNCRVAKKGATSTFEVTFNSSVITKDKIHAAIENTEGCKNPNDRPYKVKNKSN